MNIQKIIESIEEGIIELDSSAAEVFGFTSDHFAPGSYLFYKNKAIYVSFIESKKRGNFRTLVRAILEHGFTIKVPTAMGRMKRIVTRAGYRKTFEYMGDCFIEVWVLDKELNIE